MQKSLDKIQLSEHFYVGYAFRCFILLVLLPFWLVFVFDPTLLPANLAFIGPTKMTHLPILLQVIMAEVGLEF